MKMTLPSELPDITRMSEEELETASAEALASIRHWLRPNATRAQEIYDHWCEKEYWTTIEAAVIAIGLDPDLLDGIQYMQPEDAARFHKVADLLRRKFEADRVRPDEFVKWAYNKKAIDKTVVSEVKERLHKVPRPGDSSRKDTTAAKMLIAMACIKYGYRRTRSDNAVATSIMEDFETLGSGMSLSKGAITIKRLNDESK
jgi:hypothetical protein